MKRSALLFYVSGHGYGHATRVAAVLGSLRRKRPDLELHVRTRAPARLFPGAAVSEAALDDGMSQANALDVDLPATLAAHEELGRRWEKSVAAEAAVLASLKPALVAGDIPALGFAAARAAGIASAAIGNFSWDWIFSRYAAEQPRFAAIAARYRDAYASAEVLLRLPMTCPMPAFRRAEDAPLVVRRSSLSREEARARLGISAESRPVALVSFGGFGAGDIDARRGDDLSDFLFFGFTPSPPGFRGEWRELPRALPMPHVDLVAASDVVVGKPGYGTIAEVVAHGARLLYLPREGFPEIPALARYIEERAAGAAIERADFFAGRWRGPLARVTTTAAPRAPDCGGADFIAERLLALAKVC